MEYRITEQGLAWFLRYAAVTPWATPADALAELKERGLIAEVGAEDSPDLRCENAGCGSGAWLTDDDECPECGWRVVTQ